MTQQVIYEQPLNERIRNLMRLDHLFSNVATSFDHPSVWYNGKTVDGLLDILDLLSRSDIKGELTKEMERLMQSLANLANRQGVDTSVLQGVLAEMEQLLRELSRVNSQQIIEDLTSNDMISALQRRHHMTGGKCNFDQPAYHFWLEQPEASKREDLTRWFSPFQPLRNATGLVLRLIRESASAEDTVAPSGFLQRPLDTSKPNQMVRILLERSAPYYPEISGGKHRFSIRFLEYRPQQKPVQTDQDVTFRLMCCCL